DDRDGGETEARETARRGVAIRSSGRDAPERARGHPRDPPAADDLLAAVRVDLAEAEGVRQIRAICRVLRRPAAAPAAPAEPAPEPGPPAPTAGLEPPDEQAVGHVLLAAEGFQSLLQVRAAVRRRDQKVGGLPVDAPAEAPAPVAVGGRDLLRGDAAHV